MSQVSAVESAAEAWRGDPVRRRALVASVAAFLLLMSATVLVVRHAVTIAAENAVEDTLVELAATADHVADAADHWMEHRAGDADALAADYGFASRVSHWRSGDGGPDEETLLRGRLDLERESGDYAAVRLVGPDGASLLISPADAEPLDDSTGQHVARAASAGAVISTVEIGRSGENPRAFWFAPITSPAGGPADATGVVVLESDLGEGAADVIGFLPPDVRQSVGLLVQDGGGWIQLLERTVRCTCAEHEVGEQGPSCGLFEVAIGMPGGTVRTESCDGDAVLVAAEIAGDSGLAVFVREGQDDVLATVPRVATMGYVLPVAIGAVLILVLIGFNRMVRERWSERRAFAELQHALDVQDRFMANMSHDFRTPLNSILGFSGILLQELPGDLNDEQKRQLEMVDRSGRHLLALVNDVLDLSKIRAGGQDVNPVAFDLRDVVTRLHDVMCPLVAKKGLTCTARLPERGVTLFTDREKFERVLLNLLSNAIKFTDDGGVTFEVEEDGDHVEIHVRDTGPGIAPEQLGHVMDEFYQVVEEHGVKPVGTGLGLAISRRFAETLGGVLSVESELGTGTTFTLRLPTVYRGPSA